MGVMRDSVSFSLLCLMMAGCGFRIDYAQDGPGSEGPPGDGSNSPSDGTTPDGAIDAQTIMLVDRGLVARYFIDEAASGQTPTSLTDSAPSPLSLPLTFGQATFTEVNGHRGLQWAANTSSGKGEISLAGTKFLQQLVPARTVTIEVVVQITSSGGSGNESQITGMRGSNPDFMLTSLNGTDIRFFKPFGSEGATWSNVNAAQQRMVLHLVFDSQQANPSDRIDLFVNGLGIIKTASFPPAMGQTVGLGGSDEFMLGNRQQSDRSIAGTIFYVAYYQVALNDTEIASNAQRLLSNDDH